VRDQQRNWRRKGRRRINRREKGLIRENFGSIFESFVGVLGVLREGFSKEMKEG
jgi:hypothetical protein